MEQIIEEDFDTFDVTDNDLFIVTGSKNALQIKNIEFGSLNTVSIEAKFKKHVTFYPNGNRLIVYSDNLGLHLYDYYNLQTIYSYNEKIKMHCFNQTQRLVCALTETGIKFYDLRCRYFVNFIKTQSHNIKVYGDEFVGIGDIIHKGNVKMNQKIKSKPFEGVIDYERLQKHDKEFILLKNNKIIIEGYDFKKQTRANFLFAEESFTDHVVYWDQGLNFLNHFEEKKSKIKPSSIDVTDVSLKTDNNNLDTHTNLNSQKKQSKDRDTSDYVSKKSKKIKEKFLEEKKNQEKLDNPISFKFNCTKLKLYVHKPNGLFYLSKDKIFRDIE